MSQFPNPSAKHVRQLISRILLWVGRAVKMSNHACLADSLDSEWQLNQEYQLEYDARRSMLKIVL